MAALRPEEIRPPSRYEPERAEARAQLVATVLARRVRLGDDLSVGFIDSATLRGMVEEQLRAERHEDEGAVAEALQRAASLKAGEGLVALLLVESVDAAEQAGLLQLLAAQAPPSLELVGDGVRVSAELEEGTAEDPVPVLRFPLDRGTAASLAAADRLELRLVHGTRSLQTELDPEQRDALRADLAALAH